MYNEKLLKREEIIERKDSWLYMCLCVLGLSPRLSSSPSWEWPCSRLQSVCRSALHVCVSSSVNIDVLVVGVIFVPTPPSCLLAPIKKDAK